MKFKRKLALILVLLLAITIAHATPLQSFFLVKMLGLSTRLSPRLIEESATPDCSNISLDETGAIKERDVFSQYNSVPGALGLANLTGLFKYYQTVDKFFVGCAGTNVASGASGVWSDITATGNTVMASKYWSASSFVRTGDTEPTLYLFNASVPQQKWSGSGLLNDTHEAPSTNCRFSAVYKARMWASGSETFPYRLYYSSLSDPEDWSTTGGSIDLPSLAEEITGIVPWGGYLYIFTETSIYRLQGSTPNDFSLVKTISQVGAVAPLSLQVTDVGIMFLARTGVFAFNGNTSIKVSDKIDPTINAISRSAINKAAGLYDGQKKYWLSYATSNVTYNNKILIYDILLKEWYIFDNLNINYFERAFGGTDKGELYGGSSLNDGAVWLLQALTGIETIAHITKTDFETGVTFNTVFAGTESSPFVTLKIDPTSNFAPDSATHLLMHLNEDPFIDSSIADNKGTATEVVDVDLDTTNKKWGTGSADFDGDSGILTYADDSDWDILGSSTDSWTIDLWVKHTDHVGGEAYIAQRVDGDSWWMIQHIHASGIRFVAKEGVPGMSTGYGEEISDTDWHHLALCKVADKYALYKDGIQINYVKSSFTATYASVLSIGNNSAAGDYFDGNIDELRIQHSNRFNANPNAGKTDTILVPSLFVVGGTLTSDNLEINASDASTLGEISWTELLDADTDIQVTTRTGSTDDTVDWADWESWVSTSTVVNRVTGDTSNWWSSDATNFDVEETSDTTRPRDVDYYEDYDDRTPEAIKISVNGAVSKNDYIQSTIPSVDISDYKWLGFWLQAPVTESSVVMDFGEVSGNTVGQITASTTTPNEWEYHYGQLSSYTSTDIDGIAFLEFKYLGDASGAIYIADVHAYDFLDDGEVITSTPNDWIQYRAVLGSLSNTTAPKLSSLSLTYTPSSGDEESNLSSYYFTKYLDFGTPMKNKDYLDIFLEANASTDSTATIVCDWDIDSGNQSGTINFSMASTRSTVRMEKHFPSSTFGKAIRLKFSNSDKANQITIRGVEIRFREEVLN